MNNRRKKSDKILRKKILSILKVFKIRGSNFSKANILSLTGASIILFTLFIPWIKIPYGTVTESAFSSIIGVSGYLHVLIMVLVFFIVLSHSLKQKIKLLFGISFNDYLLLQFCGFLTIFSSINSIVIVSGLKIFSSEISVTGGITLSLIGGFLIFCGGILAKKDFLKRNNFINLQEISGITKEETELFNKNSEKMRKKNLKLPF